MGHLMHCGAGAASLADLRNQPDPEPRGPAHHPMRHDSFIDLVESRLRRASYDVEETKYFLNRGGDQMFGVARLLSDRPDYQPLIGFRNSHDMSCSAGLAMGMRVFVCDNMSFSGQIVIQRKHTRHIMDDLPSLVENAIDRLTQLHTTQEQRILAYKQCPVDIDQAAHLLLELHEWDVLPANKIKQAWTQFRNDPLNYDTGNVQTLWRLYNAVTYVWKRSPAQLMGPIHKRSGALHSRLDSVAKAAHLMEPAIEGEVVA